MENKTSQVIIFSGNGQGNVGCSKETPSTDLEPLKPHFDSLLTKK